MLFQHVDSRSFMKNQFWIVPFVALPKLALSEMNLLLTFRCGLPPGWLECFSFHSAEARSIVLCYTGDRYLSCDNVASNPGARPESLGGLKRLPVGFSSVEI